MTRDQVLKRAAECRAAAVASADGRTTEALINLSVDLTEAAIETTPVDSPSETKSRHEFRRATNTGSETSE